MDNYKNNREPGDGDERGVKKAAMYVRMSTDHQKYSTENQEDAIREYAERRNIQIICTYADQGKSGLDIGGREALQRLISDVENKRAEFTAILVLDVTRWGRFQDADESAYYEYVCRRAGIDVQYVAEQFENDGSPVSTIVKGVKRAMAGEYSRELSAKVFAGQCRLIEKGYRQGGPAGFGLRRMLIDEQGNDKGTLKRGEHKSLQTDRVILVPGPEDEIETVRWIYHCFVDKRMSETEIAQQLNTQGVTTDLDRDWTRSTVHQILINEKYIGNNVFNRTSCKLKKRRVNNDPDMWVRAEGVFEAIIDTRYFYTAQAIIGERSRKFSDEELLTKLKDLHQRKGWLSGILIDEMEDMPSSSAYQSRFGSLIRAYKMIGYTPERDYRYIEINRKLRKMYPGIVEDTIHRIQDLGGSVHREVTSDLIFVNGEISVSIIICRCYQTASGRNQWRIRLDSGLRPDISIAIRMDETNEQPLDYYLLPALDVEDPKLRLANSNGIALDMYRFDDLEDFFSLTTRTQLLEAA
ncbi:MAG: recombinase family protein [Alphaproteobacteria bacterium]|nr:recombinase family protein [Alphaproteobacteria bacterium]